MTPRAQRAGDTPRQPLKIMVHNGCRGVALARRADLGERRPWAAFWGATPGGQGGGRRYAGPVRIAGTAPW
jgi:hypothetical protein